MQKITLYLFLTVFQPSSVTVLLQCSGVGSVLLALPNHSCPLGVQSPRSSWFSCCVVIATIFGLVHSFTCGERFPRCLPCIRHWPTERYAVLYHACTHCFNVFNGSSRATYSCRRHLTSPVVACVRSASNTMLRYCTHRKVIRTPA